MARILDAESEVFRPVQQRVERIPGVSATEKIQQLSMMGDIATKAVPFADLLVRGAGSAYSGIHDWFAEQEQKEKAEAAKTRRAGELEGFEIGRAHV